MKTFEEACRTFAEDWAHEVEQHTIEARAKFGMTTVHLERDMPTRTFWLSVLNEEVGKLARCCNKLAIAEDERIRSQWESEGRHRLLTVASMARRMAEAWSAIPDEGRECPKHVGDVA